MEFQYVLQKCTKKYKKCPKNVPNSAKNVPKMSPKCPQNFPTNVKILREMPNNQSLNSYKLYCTEKSLPQKYT